MTPQPLETADLGQLSHFPFLYYHVLAAASVPIQWFTSDVILTRFLLRLLNVMMAAGALIGVWWLINRLTTSKLLALTVVVAYSQTTMVFFTAAGVNYDNSVTLLVFPACALTVELLQSWRINKFLLLNLLLQAGVLIKLSVLPLYLLCLLVLVIHYRGTLLMRVRSLQQANGSLLVVFVAVSLLTAFFYGRNILEYQSLNPACDQVLTHEDCLRNGIYSRDLQLIARDDGTREYNVVTYFPNWVRHMGFTLYRFLGHKTPDPDVSMSPQLGMIILAFLLGTTALGLFTANWNGRAMAFVALLYLLCLCYYFNYGEYQKHGVFVVAVQGRYLLPVLPLLYFFAFTFLYQSVRWRRNLYLIVAGAALLLIINYGYVAAARYIEQDWLSEWVVTLVNTL